MIFLDVDPYKAAESLCDKHIRHATPGVVGQTLTAILKSYNFDEKWFYEKGKSYTIRPTMVYMKDGKLYKAVIDLQMNF